MAFPLIPLAIGASAVKGIVGAIQRGRAKRKYENMERLDYTDSLAYKTALSSERMASRYAQEGLPQESLNYYADQSARTMASGISSIGSLRSGVAGVGGLATSVLDSTRRLAAMDSEARLQNRQRWFEQRANLQQQQQTAFDYEMGYDMLERARYLSEMSAGREQFTAGAQGIVNIAGAQLGTTGGFPKEKPSKGWWE